MASTTATGSLRVNAGFQAKATLAAQGTASSSPLRAPQVAPSGSYPFALAYGTGSGQADTVVAQTRTLAAGASEELILSDGSLKDVFGQAAGLATVKFVGIYPVANPDGSAASSGAVVGGAATNPNQLWFGGTTQTQSVALGGVPFQQGDGAGETVASGSADRVKVANADGANKFSYVLVVAGVHA